MAEHQMMGRLPESNRVAVTAEPRAELHRIAVVSPRRGDAIDVQTPENLSVDQLGRHRPSVTQEPQQGVE